MMPRLAISRPLLVALSFLLLIVTCIIAWAINGYDTVVAMDEYVRAQWANVESQMQRRYDLIPALVDTVKAYARHEREVFISIAGARADYMRANSPQERMQIAGKVEREIGRVLLLRERYPQLSADEAFLKLLDSLEGTENRIAFARSKYNEAVLFFNTYRRTVYGRLFAKVAGVAQVQYFAIPAAEKNMPQVHFQAVPQ
jgi:LemA protein